MSTPLVSVVTPTYNGARFIAATIESVLAQTHENLEHVIVDDGSVDGTRQILHDHASHDERVRVLCFDERAGPTRRRNDAFEAARGSYIAWLDHDDLFMPRKLELQLAALEADPSAGLAYGQYERFDDATGAVLERSSIRPGGDLLERLYVEGCFIASSTVLVRQPALKRRKLRLRDTHFSFGDDHFLWLGLALDWRGVLVDEVLTRIRVHRENESARLAQENTTLWSVALLEEFVDTYPEAAAKLGPARRRGIGRHYGHAAAYELQRRQRTRAAALAARGAVLVPGEATRYAFARIRGKLRRSLGRASHSDR
jgi:glycosyltransferase involved in cell wall biosynthesis